MYLYCVNALTANIQLCILVLVLYQIEKKTLRWITVLKFLKSLLLTSLLFDVGSVINGMAHQPTLLHTE